MNKEQSFNCRLTTTWSHPHVNWRREGGTWFNGLLCIIQKMIFVFSGRPNPRVSWWRDHALLDDVSEEVNEFESKVVNELRLVQLRREDLHSILTCQASNNNMSIPASTSVKLDMHCESDIFLKLICGHSLMTSEELQLCKNLYQGLRDIILGWWCKGRW